LLAAHYVTNGRNLQEVRAQSPHVGTGGKTSYGGPQARRLNSRTPFRVRLEQPIGPLVEFEYPISDGADFTVRQIRDAVPSPDSR
jgi:hypothetical protein